MWALCVWTRPGQEGWLGGFAPARSHALAGSRVREGTRGAKSCCQAPTSCNGAFLRTVPSALLEHPRLGGCRREVQGKGKRRCEAASGQQGSNPASCPLGCWWSEAARTQQRWRSTNFGTTSAPSAPCPCRCLDPLGGWVRRLSAAGGGQGQAGVAVGE